MDPMDYTMDDGLPHQQQIAAQRYHCQQPQLPFPRDGQYDPVHDASSWYSNQPNAQNRLSYPPPGFPQPWAQNPYPPMSGWQGYGDAGSGPAQDPSNFSPPAFTQGMPGLSPWSARTSYEGTPFGYNAYASSYANSLVAGNLGTAPSHGSGGLVTAINNMQNYRDYRAERMSTGRMAGGQYSSGSTSFSPPDHPSRRLQDATPDGINRLVAVESMMARQRAGDYASRHSERESGSNVIAAGQSLHAASTTITETQHPELPREHSHHFHNRRRHAVHSSDDDDDDDEGSATERAYRQQAALLLENEDEERHLAALRGALASGKRVPSKEALASLEKVDLKGLNEEERSCIICYNEFGVENPEGILENPLRLPKCRHIFGDRCIMKWFEDNDSCPYCRGKLPSELAGRRSTAFEAYRAMRGAGASSYRLQRGYGTRHTASEDVTNRSVPFDLTPPGNEFAYMFHRSSEFGHTPPSHRTATQDSPERRRQSRGRVGNNRSASITGRPASVGSARYTNPTANLQIAQQRAVVLGIPSSNHSTLQARASLSLGLARVGPPGGINTTPPRNRNTSSSEEASPVVAVGSFGPPGRDAGDRGNRRSEAESTDTQNDFNSLYRAQYTSLPPAPLQQDTRTFGPSLRQRMAVPAGQTATISDEFASGYDSSISP